MAEGWPIPPALVVSSSSLSAWVTDSCPAACSCLEGQDEVRILDCNRKRSSTVPQDVPDGITQISMNHNESTVFPFLGNISSDITSLSLVHNRISESLMHQLQPYLSSETSDSTSNSISEIRVGAFPSIQLKYSNLSNNKISLSEPGCFENISSSSSVLRSNRNRLVTSPSKVFRLPQLQLSELKRNKIKIVDSSTFKGSDSLKSLKMQRNGITKLMDGAFFGLNNIEELESEHNNLTEVNKVWSYDLRMSRISHISHNAIGIIRPDAWEFCQKSEELDLSHNHSTRLEETAFVGLGFSETSNSGENSIRHLGEGVFSGLGNSQTLDIRNNEISWAIEDSIAVFDGTKKSHTLNLQRNKIKSITQKAFEGSVELKNLDLSKNGIMSIHPGALSHLELAVFVSNTSSSLCDCHMQWSGPWSTERQFHQSVSAVCAYPANLLGRSVSSINPEEFVCDDFPKPHITTHPETSVALRGNNMTMGCVASSSSDSPMTTAWRKDGELSYDTEVENYARYQDGQLIYTTMLHLLNVNFTDEGLYQCVVSNHFGSNYSNRAKLTINEMPSFLKTPMDSTIRNGSVARLECAAEGHPSPQIAWQKDGGTDFPAARERRMYVMPDDDTFFIANVKKEDMGVYSCTAQNAAGSLSANATLTVSETPSFMRRLKNRTVARGETAVLQCIAGSSPTPRLNWTKDDGPLVLTERHFFVAANQLLIIVDAGPADAGKYTCIMSNILGTERGHIYLSVLPSPSCDTVVGYDQDGWTVGIVVIVVVCCVVGTSLVWVIVIYHMRRKNEDYSITNTEEMNLPADIPSYSSSQGTLSEPQEGYSNSEAGSHQQLMPPISNGYVHKGADGVCYGDTGSEVETEGNGTSHCKMGSSLTGHSSFHPGESREGLVGASSGPLVICSDCYDNANIYSRTRDYCQYSYSGEDDPSDRALPGSKDTIADSSHLERAASGSFMHSNHTAAEKCVKDSLGGSLWREGEDPSSVSESGASHLSVTLQRTPPSTSTADGAVEQSEEEANYFPRQPTSDHRSAYNRTSPQEHSAPT